MKFEQNWLRGFRGMKMLTDGRTDGRTDDGRKVITIAHPEHSSGELKKKSKCHLLKSLPGVPSIKGKSYMKSIYL